MGQSASVMTPFNWYVCDHNVLNGQRFIWSTDFNVTEYKKSLLFIDSDSWFIIIWTIFLEFCN